MLWAGDVVPGIVTPLNRDPSNHDYRKRLNSLRVAWASLQGRGSPIEDVAATRCTGSDASGNRWGRISDAKGWACETDVEEALWCVSSLALYRFSVGLGGVVLKRCLVHKGEIRRLVFAYSYPMRIVPTVTIFVGYSSCITPRVSPLVYHPSCITPCSQPLLDVLTRLDVAHSTFHPTRYSHPTRAYFMSFSPLSRTPHASQAAYRHP